MSVFAKILGTVETAFSLGLRGPQLKQGSNTVQGAIDARDAADSTFVQVRVADPVGCDDAVNLRTLNAALLLPDECGSSLFSDVGLFDGVDDNGLFSGGS